ncbi:MAG: HEAT repeat domain-containing protein [Candidatus Eremiobacterota bacterium]
MPDLLEDATTLRTRKEPLGGADYAQTDPPDYTRWLVVKTRVERDLAELCQGYGHLESDARAALLKLLEKVWWSGGPDARLEHGLNGEAVATFDFGSRTIRVAVDASGRTLTVEEHSQGDVKSWGPVPANSMGLHCVVQIIAASALLVTGYRAAAADTSGTRLKAQERASQALAEFEASSRATFPDAAERVREVGPQALPLVLESLRSCRDIEARAYLERLAVDLGQERASLLHQHFVDLAEPVAFRISLARILGSLKKSLLAPYALIQGLGDPEPEIRAASAEALGTSRSPTAAIKNALARAAASDQDGYVREVAAEALSELAC